jgi:hypothetical protein
MKIIYTIIWLLNLVFVIFIYIYLYIYIISVLSSEYVNNAIKLKGYTAILLDCLMFYFGKKIIEQKKCIKIWIFLYILLALPIYLNLEDRVYPVSYKEIQNNEIVWSRLLPYGSFTSLIFLSVLLKISKNRID